MLILFYIFAIAAVLGAMMVIASRNPVHSAISLVVTLFNVAGLYVLADATFLAAIQVLVYAGAIMVLFVFVIMLLNLKEEEMIEAGVSKTFRFVVGLLAISSFALTGLFLDKKILFYPLEVANFGNIRVLGQLLFTEYLIPFEVTSILLTVAVVGAIILAKRSLKI